MNNDTRKVLKDILEYVGADTRYADCAQLQTWIENLIKREKEDD